MNRYWTPLVDRLQPYVPGEQPEGSTLIKLNTNENPYGPSPKVFDAIRAALDDDLRLYPDPASKSLRAAIAAHYSRDGDSVFVGNGSDEVLALTFQAFFTGGKPLLFPEISYSFYPVYCNLFDIPFQTIALTEGFVLDVETFAEPNGGIIFPNPNAPTSLALGLGEIERLLTTNTSSVIVVDEAYVDFGAESAVSLVDQYPNLLVTQTFSKSRSLAGMRVGFAIGSPPLIDALNRVKDSFNSYPIDRLAQVAAQAAIEDRQWFDDCCKRIIKTRDSVSTSLRAGGFRVPDSKTNFLFVSHPEYSGQSLYDRCRSADILVRHWSKPAISDYIRITVGTDTQMAQLVTVLMGE